MLPGCQDYAEFADRAASNSSILEDLGRRLRKAYTPSTHGQFLDQRNWELVEPLGCCKMFIAVEFDTFLVVFAASKNAL